MARLSLSLILLVSLSSCSESRRVRRCEDVADPCDDEGDSRCDGRAVERCADVAGCLSWTVEEDCAESGEGCSEEDGEAVCVAGCGTECDPHLAERCNGTRIEQCQEDADGCWIWDTTLDCRTSGEVCEDSEGDPRCVPVTCEDECEPEGGTRCSRNVVQGCELGSEGCLEWTDLIDCADEGLACEWSDDGARCTDSCGDPCTEPGAFRCAGNTVQICSVEGGCVAWRDLTNCAETGLTCVETPFGEAVCTCEDLCDAGTSRCSGDVVQECRAVEGCWTWADSFDCAEVGLPCVESAGIATCSTGSGDSCADALVVVDFPFTASGADFTADFSDDQTFSDSSCQERSDEPEAVFAVFATAGSTIFLMEYSEIDVAFNIQAACDPAGPCLTSIDDFPGDGFYFDVPAEGVYYIIIERSYRGGRAYEIVIDLLEAENCGDGVDNDRDGAVDCDDVECFGTPGCRTELNCGDSADNDADGLFDCADPDCVGLPACEPALGIFEQFAPDEWLDLAGTTLTFVPDSSVPMGYRWTATSGVTVLPVAPGTGTSTPLALGDDTFAEHTFSSMPGFVFYGVRHSSMFVSSNGHITFDSGVNNYAPTIELFFDQPVVSAMWCDLNPGAGGTVMIDEFRTQVAVTFDGVPRYGATEPNTFQIVLHEDGIIDLTFLVTAPPSGERLVFTGIGSGVGIAPYPAETDFVRPGPEICHDGIDNDFDGAADCSDPDCAADPECHEVCSDGWDNDDDGLSDCDDPDCFGLPPCNVAETNCTDGADNDGDGAADCADTDCYTPELCDPYLGYWERFGRMDWLDVAGVSITFTPDAASPEGYRYAVARLPGGTLPFTPGTGTPTTRLTLPDDGSVEYALAHLLSFTFYGVAYPSIFVSSNGYVSFGAGGRDNRTSEDVFFALPAVYGMLGDLDPSVRGTVTVDELVDRVVVTFSDVPRYTRPADPGAGGNTFQIVLNRDGSIALHYQATSIADVMIGISNGVGNGTYPPESNFVR